MHRHGLLQKRQTKDGLVYRTYYDARGRPIKTTDPRVDPLSPFVAGGAARIQYVDNTDRVAWQQDTAGKQTDYAYDPVTGLLSTLTAPEPTVGASRPITRYEYDTLNRVVRTWGSGVYPTQYAYGTYGERVSVTTYQAGDVQAIWNQSTWPASAPTGQTTLWNYDGATGLLLNKTDASGEFVSYAYTRRGQISRRTWARNIKTLYTYDQGTGELTHIRYRLADETTPEGTPDLVYTYNRLGHLVSAAQSNGFTTTYDLCDCGKPLAEILDSTYYGNRRIDYHLHPTADGTKGRTMGYTLSLGSTAEQTIGYAYQANGRFGGLTVDGQQFTYGYTPLSPLIASLTHAGSNWSQARIYEENRNLLDVIETKWATVAQGRFDYVSDALGRRTSVAKSGELFARYGTNGLDTAWGYNDRSEVISEITRLGGTSTVLAGRNDAYSYDNIGNRSSTAGTTHNGTAASYTANALNQYSQRDVAASSDVTGLAPAASTVKIDGDATGITRQGDWYFKAQAYTGARPGKQALAITNWFGSAQNGPVMSRDAYVPVTPEPFAYDKDGNLIRDGRWVYQYDAENRLIAQFTRGAPADDPQANQPANTAVWNSGVARQKLQFTYDHLGRRIGKLVSNWDATGSAWVPATNRKFIYEGWNLIAELNGAAGNALLRTYAWGLDLSGSQQGAGGVGGLLAIREGGNTFLPVFDGNGNVMGMTTAAAVTFTINGNSVSYAAGSLVAAYEYDAFGQTLRETGPYAASNPIRFSTKYTDSETGQVYYGYRFYSPSLGRFINRDPIEERGGFNLYGFVGNNGISSWDYLGMVRKQCRTSSYMVCIGFYCEVKADIVCEEYPDNDPWDTGRPRRPVEGGGGGGGGTRPPPIDPPPPPPLPQPPVVDPPKTEDPAPKKTPCGELRKALRDAKLSRAAYGDAAPPGAFRAVGDPFTDPSGFRAALFENANTGERVLAYAGTNDWADVRTDAANAIGLRTQQVQLAVATANYVVGTYGSANLSFTGHSLGGLLGATASMATGLPSRTFNAAGPVVSDSYRASSAALVTNYYVGGEIVTASQSAVGFNRALGSQVEVAPADGLLKYVPGLLGDALRSGDRHLIDSEIDALQQKILNECY